MSALTEKVAREHGLTSYDDESGVWVCNCGLSIPADLEHMEHVAAVTEAETRAAVAAEIRVEMRRHDRAQVGFSAVGDAYADAARIAEGKQP